MTTKTQARHFPYQHPIFGTGDVPADPKKWKGTVYYWWWSYLRRNNLYLQTCDDLGHGPCSELYADFGDVRGDDFKAWWKEGDRGARLFAEPCRGSSKVEILKPGDEVLPTDQALTVSLPLDLPKQHLLQRLRELLGDVHHGAKGRQYAKLSRARYVLKGQPNTASLELYLEVWDMRRQNPGLSMWEIGNRVQRILPGSKIKPGLTADEIRERKKALATAVSKHLKKANDLIEKTGQGKFV